MADCRRSARTPKPVNFFQIEIKCKQRPKVVSEDEDCNESNDSDSRSNDPGLSDEEAYTETVSHGKIEKPCYVTQSSDDNSEDNESDQDKTNEPTASTSKETKLHSEKSIYSNKYFIEECISTGKNKKQLTSKNNLEKSKDPQLRIDQIRELLKASGETHPNESASLLKEYYGYFHRWSAMLENGFNLLFYGVGSKMELLEKFRSDMLEGEHCISVHGFFPGLTIKDVLNSLSDDILKNNSSFPNPIKQIEFIVNRLEKSSKHVYVLIHNIDGQVFASEKNMALLSQLARCKHIHIAASIDHVNSGLLFDSNKQTHFRWLYCDVTTFSLYTIETSYENSLLLQQCQGLEMSSLNHVFKSLTPNAKKIFELLARYQLDNCSEGNFMGLSFAELFRECREAFLVNSELTLNAQLTEYRDHNMLRSRKGVDGVEYLYIPLDKKTLVDFVEKLEEELN